MLQLWWASILLPMQHCRGEAGPLLWRGPRAGTPWLQNILQTLRAWQGGSEVASRRATTTATATASATATATATAPATATAID